MRAMQMLYKVKTHNPQKKNRLDIYMSIEAARELGKTIGGLCGGKGRVWKDSPGDPGAAATGNMPLPIIHWSKVAGYTLAKSQVRCGTEMNSPKGGPIFVDLESPVEQHIKMKGFEVHVGVCFDSPTGGYSESEAVPVHVPHGELQHRNPELGLESEVNPVPKTRGDWYVLLSEDVACGLGELLRTFKDPR